MGRRKPRIGDVVRVEWEDACSEDAWQPREVAELSVPIMVESVGFLHKMDDESVVIVMGQTEDAVHAILVVPQGMVRSILVIWRPE